MALIGRLPPDLQGSGEWQLTSGSAIRNSIVARADKRGESRAIRRGSYRDLQEEEQG